MSFLQVVEDSLLLGWHHSSYFVGKNKALQLFPMLKKENLAGGIVYYDGE